jgi:hypothetical protein
MMRQFINNSRRSGRTTRLLADAFHLALEQGKDVFVVSVGNTLQSAMLNWIQRWLTIKKDPTVFVNPNRYNIGSGSITFLSTTDSIVDWERLAIRGGYPNRVLLVDHYAIETKFKRQLEMLRRYDYPSEIT